MKKSIFYYLFAVVCTVCLFTACSDDDDDDNKAILTVDNIVGTYSGTLQVLGQPVPNIPISVSKVNAGKVKVELKNFAFSGITVGDISAECTAILDSDGNEFDLNGAAKVTVAALGNIELPITINGDATAKKLDIDINIADIPVMGNIKVEYEGTK